MGLNKGIKHTKETKRKFSEAKIGERSPKFKGWYVTPFGNFASAALASKALGIPKNTLYQRCKESDNFTKKGWTFLPVIKK